MVSQKTILLVEDEAILVMAEKKALETYGYSVLTASSGEKAIEFVNNTSGIDLILMDINLGKGMDGTQAAELILKNHDVPVVFLSSHSEREIVEKTERITSYGYVVKSSSITVLDASIKMAFKLFDANRNIRNSETKQNIMISNISDVIAVMDVEGFIKYISPNIEKWFGWKPEDLIGTDGWLTVHPDDLERIQKEYFSLLANDYASKNVEYRHKCKDGIYKPIELTATNLVHDPNINGILMNYHDITERSLADDLLRVNEERYRTLFESMSIGVFYFRPDGKISFANPFAADILGVSLDEVMQRQHTDPRWSNINEDGSKLDPDSLPSTIAMNIGKPVRNKIIGIFNQRENGYRWVRGTAIPQYRAGETSPYQVYVTMEYISELKKIEEALQESEFKYRSLIESSSDAIFCVDKNGEYQFTNQLFASTFGKTSEYFIGKTFWDIYPKEHADYRFEVTKRVFQTGQSESLEVEVPLPDRTLYFYATANPIKDKDGKVTLSLTHAVNITDRKIAEQKVQSLLAEKELILKEVHHRIKNNMNTISSVLSLQAGTLSEPMAIAAIEDAIARVQSMGILYDKLYRTADYTELSIRDYLPTLVDEVIANFPNSRMVAVVKNIDDFMLLTRPLQALGIIINELLTNIMKYAFKERESGLITVSATNIEGHVSITTQDNGTGIPASISFENSTGFGLQLVHALTQQLKGTIRMESENGTKVILEFDV